MQTRSLRPNRRALGWIGFGVGGILVYTLVLWVDFIFLQNLPVPAALSVAVQQTFNALSIGSIYALIDAGIARLINFARGASSYRASGAVVFIAGSWARPAPSRASPC
jgi:hypothetical protein